jgi:DNA-binding Xre family transcriptional regulator
MREVQGTVNKNLIEHLKMYYPSEVSDAVEFRQVGEYEVIVKCKDGTSISYDDVDKTIRRLPSSSYDISEMQCRREFALRLKQLMFRRGITQKDLSEKTGISETTLSMYLTEKHTPSFYNVDKISKALQCSLDDLRYFEY